MSFPLKDIIATIKLCFFDKTNIKFFSNDTQLKIYSSLREDDKDIVFLSNRQTGTTTGLLIYLYYHLHINNNIKALFISNSHNSNRYYLSNFDKLFGNSFIYYHKNNNNIYVDNNSKSELYFRTINNIINRCYHGIKYDLIVFDNCFRFNEICNEFAFTDSRKIVCYTDNFFWGPELNNISQKQFKVINLS